MRFETNSFRWKQGLCGLSAALMLILSGCAGREKPASVTTGPAAAPQESTTAATIPSTEAPSLATDEDPQPDQSTENDGYERDKSLASGECGEDLSWCVEDIGDEKLILRIWGEGAMYDYDEAENRAPWYEYHDRITYIERPGNDSAISSIGSYAFCDLTALEEYRFPDTVTVLGEGAFKGCTALWRIWQYDRMTDIGDKAFYGCSALTWFPLSKTTTSIGSEAFADTGIDQVHFLKTDVTVGDKAFPNTTVICGWPGSTAEAYAKAAGSTFERMDEIDREQLIGILEQSKKLQKTDAELDPEDPMGLYDPVVFSNGIYQLEDGKFLMKLVNIPLVIVPEQEMEQMLAQAKQTGKMTVWGKERGFTDSEETAKACISNGLYDFVNSDYGWLLDEEEGCSLAISRRDDVFVFEYSALGLSTRIAGDDWENGISLGWITLDGDTPMTLRRAKQAYAPTMASYAFSPERSEWYYWQLELDDNGNFVVNANLAGKK